MFYLSPGQYSLLRIAAVIAVITLINFKVNAQTSIRGTIIDKNQQILANASVALLMAKDSSLVKGTLTGSDGKFTFDKIQPGNYLLLGSFSGYQNTYTSIAVIEKSETIEIPFIPLAAEEKLLTDVTVIARKPLFEQKIDRMVINVASSITYSGTSALEVLERSPGVIVDRQNNAIAINGKNGVVVMINGRISRMPMSALVQLLSDMNSDNIEKIELITTPPANFDAEGNAGFINIVLKSNNLFGTNGSFSLTGGYSIFELWNGSINFNHRKDRVNIYGDYTYSREDMLQHLNFYHSTTNQGHLNENYSTSRRRPVERAHTLRAGIDYELNKKTIIGGLFSLYDRKWDMDAWNRGLSFTDKKLDTIVNLFNHELHTLSNYAGNLNLQHQYKEGQKLSLNFDYVYYKDWNPVIYLNEYKKPDGNFIKNEQVKSKKLTPIEFLVGSADFTKKLGKKTDMEAGIKGTLSRFTNDVQIDRLEQSGWVKDPVLSNNYDLKEDVTAAYFSLNVMASEKTSLKFGLRYEYTNSNLGSAVQKDIVDRHYGNFFPSLFLNQKINDDNSTTLSYIRRIIRPTFNDMAPFVIFVDPTYFSGNPGLQPTLSDVVSATYSYKKNILSVSYTYESSPITNFSPKLDSITNKLTLAAENQDNNKIFSVSLSLPFEITKWWSMQNNFQGMIQQLNGLYAGEKFRLMNKNFSINTTNTIRFPKEFTFSLSGFYYSSALFGIYTIKPFGSLDMGIQKKWERSSLRMNGGNLLNTMKFRPSIYLPEQNLVTDVYLQMMYPSFRITYTMNFGNSKLRQNRARATAEEEKKRVQ